MSDKHEGRDAPAPGTYGELRRQLAENGDPWSVDPLISDHEPLPKFAFGEIAEGEEPLAGVARLDPEVDVRDLIVDLPPNDPGLRRYWAEAGLPLDRIPEPGLGDRLEEPS
jgi:hypothetical protein